MEQLRVALMDYLRKYRCHDNEKMQMVALKFGMYRELAQAREEQAIKELEKLKLKNIGIGSHVFLSFFSYCSLCISFWCLIVVLACTISLK